MVMPRLHSRQRVLSLLPATTAELEEKLATSPSVVHRYLKQMEADGEAHVGAWRIHPVNKHRTRVWMAGPGTAPEKPPRKKVFYRKKAIRDRFVTVKDIEHHPLHAAFFGLGT